jgi:hypothetical protein
MIWTLGPLPLRVWNRRGLLLSIDASNVRGIATRGRTYATREVSGADVEQSVGGLRTACILRLANGTKLTVAAKWIPMKIFGPLAAMLGTLYDEEDYERDIVSPLVQRINEVLAQGRDETAAGEKVTTRSGAIHNS